MPTTNFEFFILYYIQGELNEFERIIRQSN